MTGPDAGRLLRLRMITARQPWAECIALRVKPTENRPVPTDYRGWFGIHAGRKWVHEAMGHPWVQAAFHVEHPSLVGETAERLQRELPARALVAVARLVDCHEAEGGCCPPWGARSYDGGRRDGPRRVYHWRMEDVRRIATPYPVRGNVGWFYRQVPVSVLPGDVLAELDAAA